MHYSAWNLCERELLRDDIRVYLWRSRKVRVDIYALTELTWHGYHRLSSELWPQTIQIETGEFLLAGEWWERNMKEPMPQLI